MKRPTQKLSASKLLKDYPIEGLVQDWYFRVLETSNNAWLAEGIDCWGRKLSSTGSEPDKLLEKMQINAKNINDQL
jgi:hypothetical protein